MRLKLLCFTVCTVAHYQVIDNTPFDSEYRLTEVLSPCKSSIARTPCEVFSR